MKKFTTQIASCLAISLLSACMIRDPIQMKQMPLRLKEIVRNDYNNNNLILEWRSLDDKIRIETFVPAEDSNNYHEGMIYPFCFLPR